MGVGERMVGLNFIMGEGGSIAGVVSRDIQADSVIGEVDTDGLPVVEVDSIVSAFMGMKAAWSIPISEVGRPCALGTVFSCKSVRTSSYISSITRSKRGMGV